MERCNYCWSGVGNSDVQRSRHLAMKSCQDYCRTLFICRACKYTTRGIRNIDAHNKICKVPEKDWLEDPYQELLDRIQELESSDNGKESFTKSIAYKNLIERIQKLENASSVSNFHNQSSSNFTFSSQRASQQAESEGEGGVRSVNKTIVITSNDVRSTSEDVRSKKPTKRSTTGVGIPSAVLDIPVNGTDEGENLEQSPPKKKTYKSIKAKSELPEEENADQKQNRIQKVDEELNTIKQSFGDPVASSELFEKMFLEISTGRKYTPIMNNIRKLRCSLIGSMPLDDYIELLNSHVRRLEELLVGKDHDIKKIAPIVIKGLSPLESRMLQYGNYTIYHLEVDELDKFEVAIGLGNPSPQDYVVFDADKFYRKFLNYGSVLVPIMDVFKKYIVNRYGFHNVVYVTNPKSSADDPYSFYIIREINKKKREWDMDCRLEKLTCGFMENVLPYMTSLFRKMYKDVFGDNEYRKNYVNESQVLKCDCEQLIMNIIDISVPRITCWKIREIIYKNCTYTETVKDKFYRIGDDAGQRKRLSNYKEDPDVVDTLKLLFDEMTCEQAVELYQSKFKKE